MFKIAIVEQSFKNTSIVNLFFGHFYQIIIKKTKFRFDENTESKSCFLTEPTTGAATITISAVISIGTRMLWKLLKNLRFYRGM